MYKEVYALEDEYDAKMKQLNRREKDLEEDLALAVRITEQLKEEVYQMVGGELPAESQYYLFEMEDRLEFFKRDSFEELDEIAEERRKLRRDLEDQVDAIYKKKAKEDREGEETNAR